MYTNYKTKFSCIEDFKKYLKSVDKLDFRIICKESDTYVTHGNGDYISSVAKNSGIKALKVCQAIADVYDIRCM